jgi:formyltetrahydrofolate deformylase
MSILTLTIQCPDQKGIIADVTHVSHTNSINQLVIKGRDLEKIVLARAVKNHISHKVMVFKNKTIIFS